MGVLDRAEQEPESISVARCQSFGQLMRNPIYIGKIESPDYGVSTRGDFEPIVDEATFYRAQAVLDGRVVVSGPRDSGTARTFRCAASCAAKPVAGR
jgi:recombinase